jgi:SAM-dependent methyltransferase
MSPDAYLEMAESEASHWWFSGRRAILSDLIASLDLPSEARILEIGSGTGGNLQMLSFFGGVSAMEMNATARSIALQKTDGRFDIRAGFCPGEIPFIGETFDLVCLFDVLEHIDEDVETLIAARRLLAAKGRVLMTVPAYRWLWSTHDSFLHHKRRYSADELRRKVTTAGLLPVRISYFNTLLFPLAATIRFKDRLLGSAAASGTGIPPSPINRMFGMLFGSERFMLRQFNLPFGVSLLGVLEAARS